MTYAKQTTVSPEGLLWRDDSQVADLRVVKVIGAQGEAPSGWLGRFEECK